MTSAGSSAVSADGSTVCFVSRGGALHCSTPRYHHRICRCAFTIRQCHVRAPIAAPHQIGFTVWPHGSGPPRWRQASATPEPQVNVRAIGVPDRRAGGGQDQTFTSRREPLCGVSRSTVQGPPDLIILGRGAPHCAPTRTSGRKTPAPTGGRGGARYPWTDRGPRFSHGPPGGRQPVEGRGTRRRRSEAQPCDAVALVVGALSMRPEVPVAPSRQTMTLIITPCGRGDWRAIR